MQSTPPDVHVIKIGGRACQDPRLAIRLARAWRRQPGIWFIVHGGGPQLDAALRAIEGPPRRIDGLRVTSDAGAQMAMQILDGIGADLTVALAKQQVPAIHIASRSGHLRATPRAAPAGLGRVGTAQRFLPPATTGAGIHVVSPAGMDDSGPLNVNADEAAACVARAVQATRFAMVSDVPGVLDPTGRMIERLCPADVAGLLADGTARDGMVPKLQSAVSMLECGVKQVVIGTLDVLDGGAGTALVAASAA